MPTLPLPEGRSKQKFVQFVVNRSVNYGGVLSRPVLRSRRGINFDIYSPPPAGVTREAVLALERGALDGWKEQLEQRWLTEDFPAVRKVWRKLWK